MLASQYGHRFSMTSEIGAATGIEFLAGGRVLAAAEPVRRGGGSAMVDRHPSPRRAPSDPSRLLAAVGRRSGSRKGSFLLAAPDDDGQRSDHRATA